MVFWELKNHKMASKNPSTKRQTNRSSIIIVSSLCCLFYFLGTWQKSGFGKGDKIAIDIVRKTKCVNDFSTLDFYPSHTIPFPEYSNPKPKVYFKPCDLKYTDYTPCHDQKTERHCPFEKEKLKCLIPAPNGYSTPFPWPKGRDYVHYENVPFKDLAVEKGNVLKIPGGGGGTVFPHGVDAYIDELASVIPIGDGSIRTSLDIGCGVGSWSAYLMKRNVLGMSFGAQVQFALERGVPAVIGVLGSINLPFPSRAFDMAHCSRCLIPWAENDGKYLMEVDRVLRPGGFWILSGPPINWKTHYQTWNRSKEDLKADQRKIEKLAESLCWEKVYENGDIAIWRKKLNNESCKLISADICKSGDADNVWYKQMQICVTPYPKVTSTNEVAGGELKKFPARLLAVPPRVATGQIPVISVESYHEDNQIWKKYINTYKKHNRLIGTSRYRNIMDMNAGIGSFAAAINSNKLWVMNVVPSNIVTNTLGVVYERGLIGVYHDWCEAFSTYPRTYDFIHAHWLFSVYEDKCELENIVLEIDRILRPEGIVIFRDEVNVLMKVVRIARGMRWDIKLMDHEDGRFVPIKIFIASKRYWVVDNQPNNDTSLLSD